MAEAIDVAFDVWQALVATIVALAFLGTLTLLGVAWAVRAVWRGLRGTRKPAGAPEADPGRSRRS